MRDGGAGVAAGGRKAPPSILMWDVVEEHLDEAAFLFTQWERALVSPRYVPKEVAAGPERRLLAHLDALVVAGPRAVDRLLLPGLESLEPGRPEAAALALAEVDEQGARTLLSGLTDAPPERWSAVTRTLGLCRRASIEAALREALGDGAPAIQAAAFTVLARRGAAAELDLAPVLACAAPHVQAAALRAAPLAGRSSLALVQRALGSDSAEVRDAAIDSGLAAGLRAAWEVARRVVDERLALPATALAALAMSGELEDLELLERAVEVEDLRRDAIWALGLSGWPRAAEVCLGHMIGRSARVAGEAFSSITGLRVEGRFAVPEPEELDLDLLDDEPLEEELLLSPELELPGPDAEEVAAWWKESRARFDPRIRYLQGRPFAAEVLAEAFAGSTMRRRHALARELRVRSRGAYAPETRTWARQQRRFEAEHRLVARAEFAHPFRRLLQA
jgi:uncharacterized protein (TIGR02270 family)